MALVRTTHIGSASATAFGTGAYTSASFTPSNNSLLVAFCACAYDNEATTFAPTIADSLGGVGGVEWTQQASITSNVGGWVDGARLWTREITTGTSMTVSLDHGAENIFGYGLSVIEFTGYDTSTPVTGVITKAAALDGADSVTLTAAPSIGDYTIGWLARDLNTGSATSTPGADFTEIQDFSTAATEGIETQERTGSTSTTVAWVDTNTAAGDVFRQFLVAINIKAGAGTPSAPTITSQAGGHLRAGVQWTAGADGGSAITDWDIDHATAAAPTTWLGPTATGSTNLYGAVTGLTNGTAYVFRVRGVNANGDGVWSSTSGSATPSDVRGFFLLEDGTSKFLLEDGTSKFLLESGAGDGGTPGTMYWGIRMR